MPPREALLKSLGYTFGDGLEFTYAREARINAREKAALGDVVLFEQAGQQKVGYSQIHSYAKLQMTVLLKQ